MFYQDPPRQTVAKFFLLTEKSLVSLPFELTDLPASKQ